MIRRPKRRGEDRSLDWRVRKRDLRGEEEILSGNGGADVLLQRLPHLGFIVIHVCAVNVIIPTLATRKRNREKAREK